MNPMHGNGFCARALMKSRGSNVSLDLPATD